VLATAVNGCDDNDGETVPKSTPSSIEYTRDHQYKLLKECEVWYKKILFHGK